MISKPFSYKLLPALLPFLFGCGGGYYAPQQTPTPAKAKFAYTTGFSGGFNDVSTVFGYSVDVVTGNLSALSAFPIPVGNARLAITHDPQNRFVIVSDGATDLIHVFTINGTTGALTEVNGSPFATVHEPAPILVDPSGRFVYVADQFDNQIGAYSLSSTGVLMPLPGSPFSTHGNISTQASVGNANIVVQPGGKILYVQDMSNIYTFGINTNTGVLTLLQTVTGPTAGFGLALDPAGKYLYAVGVSPILTYIIDPNSGLLTQSKTSTMAFTNGGAYTISVTPNGKFAYTVENSTYLVAYSIDDGAFMPIASYPQVNGAQIAIDPTGSFVYVPQFCQYCGGLNVKANVISEFAIGSTGTLTALLNSPVASSPAQHGITLVTQ